MRFGIQPLFLCYYYYLSFVYLFALFCSRLFFVFGPCSTFSNWYTTNLSPRRWISWSTPSAAKRNWTRRTRLELLSQMMALLWVSEAMSMCYIASAQCSTLVLLTDFLSSSSLTAVSLSQAWPTFWSCWTSIWSLTLCTGSRPSETSTRKKWTLWWRSKASSRPARMRSCCKLWTSLRRGWMSTSRYSPCWIVKEDTQPPLTEGC